MMMNWHSCTFQLMMEVVITICHALVNIEMPRIDTVHKRHCYYFGGWGSKGIEIWIFFLLVHILHVIFMTLKRENFQRPKSLARSTYENHTVHYFSMVILNGVAFIMFRVNVLSWITYWQLQGTFKSHVIVSSSQLKRLWQFYLIYFSLSLW